MASDAPLSDDGSDTTISFPLPPSTGYYEEMEKRHRENPHPVFRLDKPLHPAPVSRLARKRAIEAEFSARPARDAEYIPTDPSLAIIPPLLQTKHKRAMSIDIPNDADAHDEETESKRARWSSPSATLKQAHTPAKPQNGKADTKNHQSHQVPTPPRPSRWLRKMSKQGQMKTTVDQRHNKWGDSKNLAVSFGARRTGRSSQMERKRFLLRVSKQDDEIQTRSGRLSRLPVRWAP